MGDRKLKIMWKKDSFTPPTYKIEEYTETKNPSKNQSFFNTKIFFKLNPLFLVLWEREAVKVRLNVRGEKMNCPF